MKRSGGAYGAKDDYSNDDDDASASGSSSTAAESSASNGDAAAAATQTMPPRKRAKASIDSDDDDDDAANAVPQVHLCEEGEVPAAATITTADSAAASTAPSVQLLNEDGTVQGGGVVPVDVGGGATSAAAAAAAAAAPPPPAPTPVQRVVPSIVNWRAIAAPLMSQVLFVKDTMKKGKRANAYVKVNMSEYRQLPDGGDAQTHFDNVVVETPFMYSYWGLSFLDGGAQYKPGWRIQLNTTDGEGDAPGEVAAFVKWLEAFDEFVRDTIKRNIKTWLKEIDPSNGILKLDGAVLEQMAASMYEPSLRTSTKGDKTYDAQFNLKVYPYDNANPNVPNVSVWHQDPSDATKLHPVLYKNAGVIGPKTVDEGKAQGWRGVYVKAHVEFAGITYVGGKFYARWTTKKFVAKPVSGGGAEAAASTLLQNDFGGVVRPVAQSEVDDFQSKMAAEAAAAAATGEGAASMIAAT